MFKARKKSDISKATGKYLYCLRDKSVYMDFTLEKLVIGAVKLNKISDFDKYLCSWYGIGFDVYGSFLLSDGSGFGKNVMIFGAVMSLFCASWR